MTWIYPVAGLWIAFVFGMIGYLGRKKKFGKLCQGVAMVTLFIAVIMLAWWGVLRAIGRA